MQCHRLIALAVLMLPFLAIPSLAQDDDEYKMELGGGLGGCFYLGDANGSPYKHTGALGTAIARYVFNPRMVLKANLGVGHISGNTQGMFFPKDAYSKRAEDGQPGTASFKRNVYDLGAQFEYNFWAYGMERGYKDTHRLTPYILLGLGFTFSPKPVDNVFALNFPIGVGVKYKLKERWNIGLEWSVRFTTTDKLDVSEKNGLRLDDPYGVKSGMWKNKDCYSFTMLYLTYDLFPRCKECHNANSTN